MKKKELLELVKDIQDEQDIDEALQGSELANKFSSLDMFKEKAKTDKEFKSYLDSLKDQHLSKGIETWKQNNLQKIIDEKIKELYPEEDPKDNELKKLRIEMEDMKKETLKKELTNKALKVATEKGLPTELVDYFIGQDEETTNKNLEILASVFSKRDEELKKNLLKDNSYTPPSAGSAPQGSLDFISVIKENQVKRD